MYYAYITAYAGIYEDTDSIGIEVITLGGSGGTLYPYSTDFENSTDFNNDFRIVNPDGDVSKWELFTSTGYSGTNCVRMYNDLNTPGSVDELWGPRLDLSGITSDTAVFSFKLAYVRKGLNSDRLKVFFSKTCGEIWNKFYDKSGSDLATTPNSVGLFVPTSTSEWREEFIVLPTDYRVSNVMFKFEFTSSEIGKSLFIDDINTSLTGLSKSGVIDRSLRIYPNPVRSISVIEFDLPNQEEVKVDIFDVLGRKVYGRSYGKLPKGKHQLELGNDISHKGIYFVKVRFNNEVVARKVVRD